MGMVGGQGGKRIRSRRFRIGPLNQPHRKLNEIRIGHALPFAFFAQILGARPILSEVAADISNSDFEEILPTRSRKAPEIAERAARRTAMAAPDWSRGGSIFSAFEANAQTIANRAGNLKSRPSNCNFHGRSRGFLEAGCFE
jgi:hypothetical protein